MEQVQGKGKLHILWTTGDPVTAEKMVLMYGHNALLRGWWDAVTIILWGAASELAAGDETVRAKMRAMQADGVVFTACRACAEQLGTAEKLEALGVDVRYWGEPLTDLLHAGAPLLSV